jgi:hypothetical protein
LPFTNSTTWRSRASRQSDYDNSPRLYDRAP